MGTTWSRNPSACKTLRTVANSGLPSSDKALYRLSRPNPVSRATWVIPLERAISHPRLHFEIFNGTPAIAYETGLNVDELNLTSRQFEGLSMYFGGVQAALYHPIKGLMAAADPRRTGGIAWGEN